jgi:hypothetical protein
MSTFQKAQLAFGRLKLGEVQMPNRMPSICQLAAELHCIGMSRVVTYGDAHPEPRRNRVNMTKRLARSAMSSAFANGGHRGAFVLFADRRFLIVGFAA